MDEGPDSVNIAQLRQALKHEWMSYYCSNREWLVHLGVWVNCEGIRRPSSSFILATLTVLEPQLTQLMPLMVDLNSSPDRIVVALGLNFNPDELVDSWMKKHPNVSDVKLLAKAGINKLNFDQRQYSVGSFVQLEGAVTVTSRSSSNQFVTPSANLAITNRGINNLTSAVSTSAVKESRMMGSYVKKDAKDAKNIVVSGGDKVSGSAKNIVVSNGDRQPQPQLQSQPQSSSQPQFESQLAIENQPQLQLLSSFPEPSQESSPTSINPPVKNLISPSPQSNSTHALGKSGETSPQTQDEQCIGRQSDSTNEIWR